MKLKIFLKTLLLLVVMVIFSCDDQMDSEGVSQITYYPIITLNGEQWGYVMQGDEWTEPGATAVEEGKEIPLTMGGDDVDTSTPGVYVRTYSATNKDGFSRTEYRYIGVISTDLTESDLVGKYKRTAGQQGISTVTKLDDYLYQTDNIGGLATPGPASTVRFYHYAPGLLDVPYQIVNGQAFYCTDATVEDGVSYSWVIHNGGYLDNLRTFVKQ